MLKRNKLVRIGTYSLTKCIKKEMGLFTNKLRDKWTNLYLSLNKLMTVTKTAKKSIHISLWNTKKSKY